MSTEQQENKGVIAQATDLVTSTVVAVKEVLIGSDSPSTGAAPSPPHGDAPTNANPSGEVAFQDKSLTGKAADLTNRTVDAVSTQANKVMGTGPSSGAAPNPPHGDAPTNANPSGEVAFQDKSLTGKAADLTNRAVDTVTTQYNNVVGSGSSSGSAPNPPHGDAPTNANPSGEVAFQDKSLTGKAVDLTNRAVDAVTTQYNNVVGSGSSGSVPNPPHGDAPTNSNPSGEVAFQDKSLTGKAVDLTNRAVDAVSTQATSLVNSAVATTQQVAQVVGSKVEAAKEGAQDLAQQTKDKVVEVKKDATNTNSGTSTEAAVTSSPSFEPDPKTGVTKIVLSGFSSGDAETLSERTGYQ